MVIDFKITPIIFGKIVSCKTPTFWYSNSIDSTFAVIELDNEYRAVEMQTKQEYDKSIPLVYKAVATGLSIKKEDFKPFKGNKIFLV